ncbi:MAG TPA: hypothetical protein VF158_04140 [Longimicrobiales bacterium]
MRRIRGLRCPIGAGRIDAWPALAWLSLLLTLGLAACADEPTRPGTGGAAQEEGGHAPPPTLGLVEITISGLGTGQVTSSALAAPTVEALERLRAQRAAGSAALGGLAPQAFALPQDSAGTGDGTTQLELLSTGSFTDGVRGSGGVRYLWATYRVRNASDDSSTAYNTERRNLTFYAVDTDGADGTLGQTAISSLELFDGSPADPALAAQFIPTGAVAKDPGTNTIEPMESDVLQVLTEAEANAIQALADTAGVADVFPYGFVVRKPSDPTSRTLPASPAEDQFDGVVTFAFKVPLQASPADDPFTVSALFLAVDDDEVKLTQSVEEQTPAGRLAFDARADALGADVLTLLPPGGGTVWTDRALRVLCDVRVAGPEGSPTTTLFPAAATESWLVIPPLRPESYTLPRTMRPAVAACPSIAPEDTASFLVHGFQSVPGIGAGYDGMGTSLVRAPARPGGGFFPGEEIEVTLKSDLTGTTPVVARYRVAATGGSGTFATDTAYAVGGEAFSVALGDLDGDGGLDLATANQASNNVAVFVNR